MSVIAYLRSCRDCGIRMLVTVDSRDITLCPDCRQRQQEINASPLRSMTNKELLAAVDLLDGAGQQ